MTVVRLITKPIMMTIVRLITTPIMMTMVRLITMPIMMTVVTLVFIYCTCELSLVTLKKVLDRSALPSF